MNRNLSITETINSIRSDKARSDVLFRVCGSVNFTTVSIAHNIVKACSDNGVDVTTCDRRDVTTVAEELVTRGRSYYALGAELNSMNQGGEGIMSAIIAMSKARPVPTPTQAAIDHAARINGMTVDEARVIIEKARAESIERAKHQADEFTQAVGTVEWVIDNILASKSEDGEDSMSDEDHSALVGKLMDAMGAVLTKAKQNSLLRSAGMYVHPHALDEADVVILNAVMEESAKRLAASAPTPAEKHTGTKLRRVVKAA